MGIGFDNLRQLLGISPTRSSLVLNRYKFWKSRRFAGQWGGVGVDQFESFYALHSPNLGRFIARRAHSERDDIMSEVFLIAWRKWKKLPTDPDEQKLWLYATARRVMANKSRLRSRLTKHLKSTERLKALNGALPHDNQPNFSLAVHEALLTISQEHREVLMLTEWDGLSTANVANILDLPETTVTKRLHAARFTFAAAYQRLVATESESSDSEEKMH